MKKTIALAAMIAFAAASGLMSAGPASAKDDGGASCVKRQMAKGRSECIAKLQCSGNTSRKDQARLCP